MLANPGLIRNRLKLTAAINNAQRFLEVQKEFGSFTDYIWAFVDNQPVVNSPRDIKDYPTRSEQSDALSKDLIKRGFKFVGPTIVYAWAQAVGMVNDHEVTCPRHAEVQGL